MSYFKLPSKLGPLLLYLWVISSFQDLEARNLTIAMSTSTKGPTFRSIYGGLVQQGIDLYLDWANQHTMPISLANGITLDRVVFVGAENADDPNLMAQHYEAWCNDTSIDFLLAPIFDDFAITARQITDACGRVLVGMANSDSRFFSEGKLAIAVTPASYIWAKSFFVPARIARARNMTMLLSPNPSQASWCNSVIDDLPRNNISLLRTLDIPETLLYNAADITIPQEVYDQFRQAVETAREVDADILFVCEYPPAFRVLGDVLKQLDYTPKAVIFSMASAGDNMAYDLTTSKYFVGHHDVIPAIDFIGDEDGMFSWSNYTALYTERFGFPPVGIQGFASMGPMLIVRALSTCKCLGQEDAFRDMVRSDLSTFFGRFTFDPNGGCRRPTVLSQLVDEEYRVLGPGDLQRNELIYPMPTWRERVFDESWRPSEITMFVISALGWALDVACMIILLKFRKHEVMRASSPLFMGLMVLGAMILKASVFVWTPFTTSTALCHLRPWFLAIGFALLFGSLFAKTWRVYYLWNLKTIQIVRISNLDVFVIVAVVVGINAVLCAIWSGVTKPQPYKVTVDPHRDFYSYYECPDQGTAHWPILAIILAVNFAMMIYGTVLAIKVKDIKRSLYNESRIMHYTIYNVLFFSIVVTALQVSGSLPREGMFILRSLCIFAGTATAICLIFGTKLYQIRLRNLGRDLETSTLSGTNLTQSKTSYSSKSHHNKSILPEATTDTQKLLQETEQKLKQALDQLQELRAENNKLKQQLEIENQSGSDLSNSGSSSSNEEKMTGIDRST